MRRTITTALAALIGGLVLSQVAPWPSRLGSQRTGDRALADEAARLAGVDHRRGLAVAVLRDGVTRAAGVGDAGRGRPVLPDTPFQPGSVTKTFTGALLAVLAEDGAVRPDDRLADLPPPRPWRDPVGAITLAQLAGQRSGLPRLRGSVTGVARAYWAKLTGANPYGSGPVDIFAEADAAAGQADAPGEFQYSNLGYALLGGVLAARAGTSYPELLRARLLEPLGLAATAAPDPAAGPPPGAATGHDTAGRELAHSNTPGWTPAGTGTWSTVGDLARYADATMRGTAPGADAARPRWLASGADQIGYAWITTPTGPDGSGGVVWHNGSVGGQTSFVGFDRARGLAVAVLSNTEASVDDVGMALLGGPVGRKPSLSVGDVLTGAVLPVFGAVLFLLAARGRRGWPSVLGTAVLVGLVLAMSARAELPRWAVAVGWLLSGALLGPGVVLAARRLRGRAA